VLPYTEAGSGEVVVLLHAGVADRTMWDEHLGRLADAGYRALALDLPGFGEAAIGPGPQAPWNDVLETLRELDVQRAALVGISFGAAVALRVAVIAPAAVSALVLISPPPVDLDPSDELRAAWDAERDAIDRGDIDAAVAAVVDAWTLPDAPAALRDRLAALQRQALELQMAAGDVEEAPDPLEGHPELLSRLTMRTLAAAGEHDMPDFKLGAEQLAAALPQAGLVTIEGAGHLAPLEVPAAFDDLLLEFLSDSA
jgi:pimeloyl-ACP methyl ester carboxylesterase